VVDCDVVCSGVDGIGCIDVATRLSRGLRPRRLPGQ
jgi:hypothetical protein